MFHPFIRAQQHTVEYRCSRKIPRYFAEKASCKQFIRLCQPGQEHPPPRLRACKYFSQNWLQGLSRRDLRHQIFCNWGSPATFSMFYTNLKMASISHAAPVSLSSRTVTLACSSFHLVMMSRRPCPCFNSLHV